MGHFCVSILEGEWKDKISHTRSCLLYLSDIWVHSQTTAPTVLRLQISFLPPPVLLPIISLFTPIFQSIEIIHSGAHSDPVNQTQMQAVNPEWISPAWACCQSKRQAAVLLSFICCCCLLMFLSTLAPLAFQSDTLILKTDTPVEAINAVYVDSDIRSIQVFASHRPSSNFTLEFKCLTVKANERMTFIQRYRAHLNC